MTSAMQPAISQSLQPEGTASCYAGVATTHVSMKCNWSLVYYKQVREVAGLLMTYDAAVT